MSLPRLVSRAVFAGVVAFSLTAPVTAAEITESHIVAALDAIRSAGAAKGFDNVLPAVADRVKNQLIRLRPDLHKQISQTVEDVALKLVARRTDLDNDIARIWANAFTEEELNSIAAFYKSEAGKKFAELGPKVINDTYESVSNWSDRIGEELLEKAREELKKQGIEF
jgi:hypothetical protein